MQIFGSTIATEKQSKRYEKLGSIVLGIACFYVFIFVAWYALRRVEVKG
jgi:hypothetical protein